MRVRTSAASYLLFDDNASGTGGAGGGTGSPSSPMSSSPPASSGTPGTAPSPAPAPVVADSGSSTPSNAGSDPFAGMDNEDWGLDDVVIPEEPVTGTDPGAAPAGEPKPAVAAKPEGTVPPAPVAPAAPVPPATNERSSIRSPLDEAIEGFKANKVPLTEWAAGEIFKLSPEEQAALDTDAQTMIPKLMARTYVEGLTAAKNLIRNFVPGMIASEVAKITSTQARSSEALNQFYGEHKELDRAQHQPVVDKWLKVYRATNPQASRKEAIDFVGRAVKLELGIAPGTKAAPRVAPFAPARQGGRAPNTSQVPHDPYAGMDMDFGEEVE